MSLLRAAGGASQRLVTGVTGQDGSFLAELLLERGYDVVGMVRRPPPEPLGASEHLRDRIGLVAGDLLDPDSLRAAVADVRGQELFHLAAPSFVPIRGYARRGRWRQSPARQPPCWRQCAT